MCIVTNTHTHTLVQLSTHACRHIHTQHTHTNMHTHNLPTASLAALRASRPMTVVSWFHASMCIAGSRGTLRKARSLGAAPPPLPLPPPLFTPPLLLSLNGAPPLLPPALAAPSDRPAKPSPKPSLTPTLPLLLSCRGMLLCPPGPKVFDPPSSPHNEAGGTPSPFSLPSPLAPPLLLP